MSDFNVGQISGNGMNLERAGLEMAALKISLMNVSFSSQTEASNFLRQLGVDQSNGFSNGSAADALTIKKTQDKSNPQADEFGDVYKIDVDPTREMATLISATRAYEANVRAYNANGAMNKAAFDIGSK